MDLSPLVVDLDGTLVRTDTLHELILKIFRSHPLSIFLIPFWIFKGKALFKAQLASSVHCIPKLLPYNNELLDWLKQQKLNGRKLILCTASNRFTAVSIASYLAIFDEVIASDHLRNLSAPYKAEILEQRFGRFGFDYIGNSRADLTVWKIAKQAIIVQASNRLVKKTKRICVVRKVFPSRNLNFKTWSQTFRLYQWLKNLLLFVPLLASHQFTSIHIWASLTLSFFSFSLCASSTYINNDLMDLESDRIHPHKKMRPFASGQISTQRGAMLSLVSLLMGLGLGSLVNLHFLICLVFYSILASAYSLYFKRLILIDCFILMLLYTLRIIAGATAIHCKPSFWLLACSNFLFLSLAFIKRYAELKMQHPDQNSHDTIHGRGYYPSDILLIQILGITSGHLSVLILALYLRSSEGVKLYPTPEFIWSAVFTLLFWMSWMWMQAHRGKMSYDPLIFAIKNKTSLFTAFTFLGIMSISSVRWGWPW